MALPTDAFGEISPKKLPLQLFSKIADLGHNAGKRAEAAWQRYKRHHDAQVRE